MWRGRIPSGTCVARQRLGHPGKLTHGGRPLRKRCRAHALSWPVGPGTRLSPEIQEPLCLLSRAGATSLSTALHTTAQPRPGGRAGGQASRAPSATGPVPRNACSCPALLAVTGSPGWGCRTVIRAGQSCRLLWPSRVGVAVGDSGEGFQTVSFSVELHRPYLLSCQADSSLVTQKKTPPKTHNPYDPLMGLKGGLATGSFRPPICPCTLSLCRGPRRGWRGRSSRREPPKTGATLEA